MGKFIDTQYTKIIDNISDTVKTFLNNPYYQWNDKKPTIVYYCNINTEMSTLDEGARIIYSNLGPDCPLRYNLIKDFVVYGIDRIAITLENGEYGLEGNDITGDVIILPNTITPYPGDYFWIKLAKDSTWLFNIKSVDKDTLDNGSNIWKCSYKLEFTSNKNILPLIVEEYRFVINNIGTRYNTILESKKFDLLDSLDRLCTQLKKYYIALFYNQRVQTFIFTHYGEDHFYDPYMIEFLIRNNILANGAYDEYIYIDHKISTKRTFAIDYNRTFFRALEDRDINALEVSKVDSTADYIDEFGSIFASRPDNYWQMNYFVPAKDPTPMPYTFHNVMTCFPKDLIIACKENKLYDDIDISKNEELALWNIIIKHFNHTILDENDYRHLMDNDYGDTFISFYFFPMIIYAIENYEKELLLIRPKINASII